MSKTNLVLLANTANKDDLEFYQMVLETNSYLHLKAIVLLFSSVDQFDDFLQTMSPDYEFALLVHMGKWPHKVTSAGDLIADKIQGLTYGSLLKFDYTSRDGDDTHNSKQVWHTPKLTMKTFPIDRLPVNRISELMPSIISETTKPESEIKPNDFAILTALDEHENDIFRAFMHAETLKELDGQTYSGRFVKHPDCHNDYDQPFILASQKQMGMVDAAFSTLSIIQEHKPQYLIMSGVCGGRKSKVKLFDIIIPEKVFDFSYGSLENGAFLQRDLDAKISPDLISWLKKSERKKRVKDRMIQLVETRDNQWLTHVQNAEIHFDVMACGPWVVKTEDFLETLSEEKNNLIRGLEMESYSLGRAFELYGDITKTLVVKSVMDYTDSKKDDKVAALPVKKIAGYISCLCVRAILPMILEYQEQKTKRK